MLIFQLPPLSQRATLSQTVLAAEAGGVARETRPKARASEASAPTRRFMSVDVNNVVKTFPDRRL